jgi:ADP-ribosylglycohydrolase
VAPLSRPLPNSYWVLPGRLLAGEYPAGITRAASQDRLQLLLAAGIDFFFDLTEPGELESYEDLLPGSEARRAVLYRRVPIHDHGLPESVGHMEEILSGLDAALAEGRHIYLHCRAGIGRTNLVVGCWLARDGLGGEKALLRLNRLWQASDRSLSWPNVPETAEQCEFVRSWRARSLEVGMAADAAPATDRRERVRGLLLGLATGDALGQATRGRHRGSFPPVAALAGGGPLRLPAGAWSDKTAMALCLAESMVAKGGLDAADQVERYLEWQRSGRWSSTGACLGISTATVRALATAHWTGNPYAGSHDPAQADAEPLARIGPAVALFRTDPRAAMEAAANCARITHQAPLTLDAVRYFAALLAGALSGEDKAELLAPNYAPLPEFWDSTALRPEIHDLAAGTWRGSRPRAIVAGAHAAAAALSGALWAFDRGRSLKECLIAAASLGGESDTTAAIVGQLAGAHYGAAALPPEWRGNLVRGDEIEALADALFDAAQERE